MCKMTAVETTPLPAPRGGRRIVLGLGIVVVALMVGGGWMVRDRIRDRLAEEWLLRRLEDPRIENRKEALRYFTGPGLFRVVPRLVAAMASGDNGKSDEGVAAQWKSECRSFILSRGKQAVPGLRRVLTSGAPKEICVALSLLVHLGPRIPEVAQDIEALLGNADGCVRHAAGDALAGIGCLTPDVAILLGAKAKAADCPVEVQLAVRQAACTSTCNAADWHRVTSGLGGGAGKQWDAIPLSAEAIIERTESIMGCALDVVFQGDWCADPEAQRIVEGKLAWLVDIVLGARWNGRIDQGAIAILAPALQQAEGSSGARMSAAAALALARLGIR